MHIVGEGKTLTICTDDQCPVHDPDTAARIAKEEAENPQPVMEPSPIEETEEEAQAREAEYEQRREQERQQQMQREQEEQEAERVRKEETRKIRLATFDRILDNALVMFSTAQLRVLLTALVNVDPYDFRDR